jgi:polar amino acid transport system substrate-binding protein
MPHNGFTSPTQETSMRSARLYRLMALFVLVGVIAAGCSSDDDGDSSSSTTSSDSSGSSDSGDVGDMALVSDGTLTVCSDIPYAPFEFEDDDGSYTGFDIELLEGVAEDNDLDLEVRVSPFDTIIASLEAGDCDLIASAMTITDERAEQVDFSDPYFDSDQSLLIRVEDEGTFAVLDDLAGETIGVQSGTTGEEYANENTPEGATIKAFETGDALFPALASDDIAAALQDFPVNAYRATQGDEFVVTETVPTGEQYGFAISKGNAGLLAAVNDALTDMREDGRYDEIYATWFGDS